MIRTNGGEKEVPAKALGGKRVPHVSSRMTEGIASSVGRWANSTDVVFSRPSARRRSGHGGSEEDDSGAEDCREHIEVTQVCDDISRTIAASLYRLEEHKGQYLCENSSI